MPTILKKYETEEEKEQLAALEKDREKNVALAVQRVFFKLQSSDVAVDTKELTKSFGWGFAEAFQQHDVQEFLRVLLDKLEEKMKDKPLVDGLVQTTFEGKMKSYIKCTNVEYESARTEAFLDIQLRVKGMKTLEDSFKDYCSVEMLDGENKYQAEGHGLQDAKKGMIFEKLPNVLQLQLRRFEYNMELDESVKVNDRFEFPLKMNLDEFLNEKDANDPAVYVLHSVLTQMGSVQYGHYIAYIRPDLKEQWYKFDDDMVTKCPVEEALESNFGGAMEGSNRISHSNAYMLVYVRETPEMHKTYARDADEVPRHLAEYFKHEEVEAERRSVQATERAKYFNLNVVMSQDLIGEIVPDIISKREDRFQHYDIPREITNTDLYKTIAERVKVPPNSFRLHNFIDRRNKTFRPEKALRHGSSEQWARNQFIFLQSTKDRTHPHPVTDMDTTDDDPKNDGSLIFFKKFDSAKDTLEMFAVQYVDPSTTLTDLIPFVKANGGFAADDKLQVSEELTHKKIPLQPIEHTLSQAELEDGDILIWETVPGHPSRGAEEFYLKTCNTAPVHFKPLNVEEQKDEAKCLELEMDLRNNYTEVTERLAAELSWTDPKKIQLTQLAPYDSDALHGKRIPSTADSMYPMFITTIHSDRVLYYEQLDMDIAEVEKKVFISDLSWLNFDDFTLTAKPSLVSPDATVADIIRETISDKGVDEDVNQYRLLHMVNEHTIHSIENPDTAAKDLSLFKLRVERIPAEQIDTKPGYLIQAQHVFKMPGRCHGVPFYFAVHEGETLIQIAERLRTFLKVEPAVFETWRISLQLDDRTTITDADTDFTITKELIEHHQQEIRILLDHKVQHHKRFKRTIDSAIKIHN